MPFARVCLPHGSFETLLYPELRAAAACVMAAAAAVLYAFERKRNAFSHRQRGRETLMFGGNERIDRRAGWRLEKQVFEICEVARLDKDHWRARRKAIEVSLCKLVSP